MLKKNLPPPSAPWEIAMTPDELVAKIKRMAKRVGFVFVVDDEKFRIFKASFLKTEAKP